jgi:hypothetical protein
METRSHGDLGRCTIEIITLLHIPLNVLVQCEQGTSLNVIQEILCRQRIVQSGPGPQLEDLFIHGHIVWLGEPTREHKDTIYETPMRLAIRDAVHCM